MAQIYRCKDGDVLDWICVKHYGRHGLEVQVLEANPGLADQGPVLTAGEEITLPDLPETNEQQQTINLWD